MSAPTSSPDTWEFVGLNEIAQINPRSFCALPISGHLPVHFIAMGSVCEENGGIDVSTRRSLDEVSKGYTSFLENDVLFAKITPCMENGKVAVVPKLSDYLAFGSTEFHVVRSLGAALPKWILYYLGQSAIRKAARQNMTGSAGQMRVPTNWLSSIKIPIPPIDEQSRIIEAIDELTSDLDAGVAELKAAQKKLARYRQSLLRAAVDGVLTETWRQGIGMDSAVGDTALQFLSELDTARAIVTRSMALDQLVDKAQLRSLPQGWTWASVERVLGKLRSGSTETSGREPTDFPVLKSSAVRRDAIDFKSLNYLTEAQSDSKANWVEVGDVLITRLSGSVEYVGLCALVTKIPQCGVQYPDRLFRGKLPAPFVWFGRFIVYYFQTSYVRTHLEDAAKSTAGHKRISLSDLKPILIPVPPMSEAQEIISRADKFLDAIEDLERNLNRALAQAAAQRQNIFKAAFSGQLVPQDPTDEPASVLLERIRAERATRPAKKTTRPRKSQAAA